jgi:hypothetical protein
MRMVRSYSAANVAVTITGQTTLEAGCDGKLAFKVARKSPSPPKFTQARWGARTPAADRVSLLSGVEEVAAEAAADASEAAMVQCASVGFWQSNIPTAQFLGSTISGMAH